MIKLLFPVILFLVLGFVSSVSAVTLEGHSTAVSTQNAASMDKQIEIKSTPNTPPVLKTENSNFEAKGKITSISGDNFDVEGVTITKSPNHLISVSGNIEVGKNVEVKGVLENGLRYAKEIKIEGSSTPTPSPTSTPQPSQNNSNPVQNTSSPQTQPAENPGPAVLSQTKTNPNPSHKPVTSNLKPNLVIGNQNIPVPSVTKAPSPSGAPAQESNYFFKPVVNFFESLFKGWF